MKKYFFILLMALSCNSAISQCNYYASYPFNGNANDEGINNLHGVVTGATLTNDRFGIPNQAYSFSGGTNYIELAHDFDFPQRTINVWFKADTTTSTPKHIYDSDHPGMVNASTKMWVWTNGGIPRVGMSTGTGSINQHNEPINLHQWYMGTIVVGSDVKFYLNAQLIATFALNPGNAVSGNSTALIGASRLIDRFFDGTIDDASVYNCALSVNSIYDLYYGQGVMGFVYQDFNQNCLNENNEIGIANRMAIINPGNIIVETSSNGSWYLDSLPAGNYSITLDTSGNWESTCPTTQNFTVNNPDSLIIAPGFGLLSTQLCTEPYVSVHMPFIRRCFSDQKLVVQVNNNSTATDILNNGYVILELDSLLMPTSSSIPYLDLGNQTYRFDLSNTALYPGQYESFWMATTVSCDALLGQTLCMDAELFPIAPCVLDTIPADPPADFTPCSLPWDQSSISVDGWCDNDSIYFTITNTGSFGGGDMECYSPIRLYIDGQYMWLDSLMITGGTVDTLVFAGDGRTWRLEADQHPLHPGNSHPNAVVELCGDSTNWTSNLVNVLPMDDADPIVDIYCGLVTGSWDPNDKTGFPLGVSNFHFIAPNGNMEYVIRFQNTGSDTAFNIVVRDTLDIDLDIFSVVSGASSNSYTFQKYGPRVLEWTFNNIMLPDSTTDEPGSHGFVSFTVDQMPDLPDGTELNNTVGIYFDFNSPVITNTTSHIIYRDVNSPVWQYQTNLIDTACFNYVLNDIKYDQSGEFYQISNDTLITLDLFVAEPDVNAFVDNDSVCLSENVILYGTGAQSYAWSNGVIDNQNFAPSVSQMYYVDGMDQFGCIDSDSIYVFVNDTLLDASFTSQLNGGNSLDLDNTSTTGDFTILWTINTVPITTQDAFNYVFTANGLYNVCLTVTNECSSDTECRQFDITEVGINENENSISMSVYPNPASSILSFEIPFQNKNINYSVKDILGNEVLNGSTDMNSIDISKISSGIYLLQIEIDGLKGQQKFIKN